MVKKISKKREVLIKIGKSIQFWRKLAGHDQESFSKVLKTVRSYISRIESGHSGISLSRIREIAEVLGVSAYTLLRGVPAKEEAEALLDLYKNSDYQLTKAELEDLYCCRLRGKVLTRDYYVNQLSIIRSGIYTQK